MQAINMLYKPNHDEAARQAFVGTLKGFVNGPMEADLARLYDDALANEKPASREEAMKLFENKKLYQLWGSSVYTSQDFLWEGVGETVDRVKPEFEEKWRRLEKKKSKRGSLHLDSDMKIPEPIASREIHRQPGGYFHAESDDELTAPLLYFASIELYRTAKGLGTGAKTGEPGMSEFITGFAKDKFPGLDPKRILDLGCGPGTETLGFKRLFPEAEIHGLDLSAPFVKFGHLWAEEQDEEIHFHQGNAADTGLPDDHFDFIVSHILFHETSDEILPQIMKEAHRLLAPGGLFLSADVAYQKERLSIPKQVTNHWQVVYNGEPFWTGFADTDVSESLLTGGFAANQIFADYVPIGTGHYYLFGATKSA